jgi:hypothetical protein
MAIDKDAWAVAECNEKFICIETYSYYGATGSDPLGSEHLLPPDADDASLGTAILDALSRSRELTAEEAKTFFDWQQRKKTYAEWIERLKGLYGYKTKRAMFKNMKSCDIKRKGGQITIEPSHHDKLTGWSGEGISPQDYAVVNADSPPDKIGAALRLAFERCT